MFYANNEQVKGIFLNGRNYNYLASGFGKIIPEDRNAEQLNLNLAYKYLNKYRVEFGTVKDGYENALVCPRFDKPDSNGIFHTPFTYYYNGNIIPTKEVNILITDGNYALRNALVYNDMNINGNINYFAANTDFQGHNVNVFPEKDSYQVYQALLNYEMLNNCSNFDLNIETRFSKASYPTLYNCNNFSGNFRYVGNQDYNYPGFRGFLYECKDGVFNIDCTNMHGGGNDANVTNYFNFSGIQRCNNIKLSITGSSWQVWPHDHSFSSNCNINTYNVISGFGCMNYCNFNVELPKDSKPEMDRSFPFLNNAENCNYNLQALDSNLFNYRSGVGHSAFFEDLNNCNLNLQVNNTVSFSHTFGNRLNNCNIVFDNIKADLATFVGWYNLYNCRITGNVETASSEQGFIEHCDGLNVNLNFAKSSRVLPMYDCNNIRGNLVAGDDTWITLGNYVNLNVSRGNLHLTWIEHSNFNLYKATGTAVLNNLNNVNFVERGGAKYTITYIDNCRNSWIYANTVSGTIENVYNTRLELVNSTPKFKTWRVDKCEITGFPVEASYTSNCTFNVGLGVAMYINSSYITWNNVWPHGFRMSSGSYRYLAGLRSVDGFISHCFMSGDDMDFDSSKIFVNSNNMQTDLGTYYKDTVTANLPIYNMNIKLNVDCNTLNLGVFQSGPPHGFQNATISANDIYCTTGKDYYVQVNCDTKIYCENYCNVCFYPDVSNINSVLQPVVLINNYRHSNSVGCNIRGGLTRIGSLNFQGGAPANLTLYNGAFVFINNALLGTTSVNQNSVLFLGSNVRFVNTLKVSVSSGGLIVGKLNWSSHASEIWSRIGRGHLAWNVWDTGPWGSKSLFDYCINV
ncbi:MAG: hypothetical protein UHK60_00850 [Acutalibacteraceae bacterium]|nr:hypothetical protein [Acutalibacteraceae bacterium]